MTQIDAENNDARTTPTWSQPVNIPQETTNAGPRCTRRNGIDWIVWKGESDNEVWYTNGTKEIWSTPISLGFKTNTAPAIAAYNDNIYVFWTDADSGRIVYAVYNDVIWERDPDYYVSIQRVSDGPALAVHDGRLYVAWKRDNNCLSYAWLEGETWYASWDTYIASAHMPAITAYSGKLYFAICSDQTGTISLYSLSGNILKKVDETGTDITTDAGPALASDGEKLWMMWKEMGGTSIASATRTAGTGWSGPVAMYDWGTQYSPGLCGDSYYLRLVWSELSGQNIYTTAHVEPGSSIRLIPPCITHYAAEGNEIIEIAGKTAPGAYVFLELYNGTFTQHQPPTMADVSGNWLVSIEPVPALEYNLVTINASIYEDSKPSDDYTQVLTLKHVPPPVISSVTDQSVSGETSPIARIIKGWRLSDGALMVDYRVPTWSDNTHDLHFEAEYCNALTLEQGDTLFLVAQDQASRAMSPYAFAPEGYSRS